MGNQFFEPGFLFDFYSDRGSTATLSPRSNVSRCGLGIFRSKPTKWRFCIFSHVWSPVTEKWEYLEKQFSAVW